MDLKEKVNRALEHIRPAIRSDGGDVEVLDVREGRVYLRLQGHCQGCPSSTITLRRGIMAVLQREVPEVKEIVEVLPDGKERVVPQGSDDPWAGQSRIPGVQLVLAVASGKGGVGKSTVAVNLALALHSQGLQVGLLDADIYGPSAPTMLGVRTVPPSNGQLIKPAIAYGIKVISIGFFIPPDAPLIWRGPMVMKAVDQFLNEVDWAPLDVLVVDLPPGTGDAQLTLAQRVPVDGAIIVTTSSDVALIDARKGLQMFHKVNVPVLGIVENMSHFVCPHCGHRTDIFDAGKGKEVARQLGVDFMGEIPLDPYIRQSMDQGKPVVIDDPSSPQSQAFIAIARRTWEKLTTMYPQWQLNACHVFIQPQIPVTP